MPDPAHGTRSTYQQGCKCVTCRSANAAYEQEYRRLKRQGKQPLGATVSAIETRRQLRVLLKEYGTQTALAFRLGMQDRHVQVGRRRVCVGTANKVCHIYQVDIMEAPYVDEKPHSPA